MKSYLGYQNQIDGFKDVSDTVKTVEQISASSVHWLKQEVSNLNSYTDELETFLSELTRFTTKLSHPLLQEREHGKKMLLVISGDKGLVGGLWHNVINAFLAVRSNYDDVVIMGKKGEYFFEEEGIEYLKSFVNLPAMIENQEVSTVTDFIFGEFKKGSFSRVDILYPKFVSLANQQPTRTKFLPFTFSPSQETESQDARAGAGLPIFEPNKSKIFDNALEKYISVFFNKIVLESRLSELSARTVAMEHATVKTNQLIERLSLDYMKVRRKSITQKQVESFVAHKVI